MSDNDFKRLEREIEAADKEIQEAKVVRARLDERIKALEEFKKSIKNNYVTVEEFAPRRKIIDGIVTTIIGLVFAALMGLVIVKYK